jgi:hypothetical protein
MNSVLALTLDKIERMCRAENNGIVLTYIRANRAALIEADRTQVDKAYQDGYLGGRERRMTLNYYNSHYSKQPTPDYNEGGHPEMKEI